MTSITFTDTKKSRNTVGKLLGSLLPGHGAAELGKTKNSLSSASQIINAQQKKQDPEKVRRLQKKEKLNKRKQVRKQRETKDLIFSKARFEVLQKHAKEGTLQKHEKIELKKLVSKNIAGLESWRTDIEEDLQEVQKEILKMRNDSKEKKAKRQTATVKAKELYEKKKEQRYPGLTPGLAPVGLDDSDDEDDF